MYSLVMVNWIGVIVATVVAIIVGMIWYSPKLFGKIWQNQTKIDMQKSMKKGRTKSLVLALVAALITAFVLDLLIVNSAQTVTLTHAIETAVVVWLGFVLTYQMVRMSFENNLCVQVRQVPPHVSRP